MKLRLVLADADKELVLIKYGFRPTSLDNSSSGELVTDESKAITLSCQNCVFKGHMEQYDGTSYVDCVVAGTSSGEVKLFKVKNKANLKLHNSTLPSSSSVEKVDSAPPTTPNLQDKQRSEKKKRKKEINSVTEILKRKRSIVR